nr:hypothetical protein [Aminithiophilus ramosus]
MKIGFFSPPGAPPVTVIFFAPFAEVTETRGWIFFSIFREASPLFSGIGETIKEGHRGCSFPDKE